MTAIQLQIVSEEEAAVIDKIEAIGEEMCIRDSFTAENYQEDLETIEL